MDPPLRVATWNVKGGQLASLERLGAQLGELNADVVGLQELFFDARWNGHVNLEAELSRLTAMQSSGVVTLTQDDSQGPFGAEVAGQAVLIRDDTPVDVEPIALASGQRVGARFRWRGIDFASVHLPTGAPERLEGLAILAATNWEQRAVLMGDLNTSDLSVFEGVFPAPPSCGLTWPAGAPRTRIDWVLARGFQSAACSTVDVTTSDHVPVVVTLNGEASPPIETDDRPEAALFAAFTPQIDLTPSLAWPASQHVVVAVVDTARVDELGLPTPLDSETTTLKADDMEVEFCSSGQRGVRRACREVAGSALELGTPRGDLHGVVRPAESVAVSTVESIDGRAMKMSLHARATIVPPSGTAALPTHPRHRRLDVQLTGPSSTHLAVQVVRARWDGATFSAPEQIFSTLPTTAKDVFDELKHPQRELSVPGTAFTASGLYAIITTTLERESSNSLGGNGGLLSGRSGATLLWVE